MSPSNDGTVHKPRMMNGALASWGPTIAGGKCGTGTRNAKQLLGYMTVAAMWAPAERQLSAARLYFGAKLVAGVQELIAKPITLWGLVKGEWGQCLRTAPAA